MVLKQLNNDLDLAVIVFDGNSSHDVSCVLGVGIIASFIGKYHASVSFFYLFKATSSA